jgi:polar amino acid transport system permease protein
MFHFNVFVHYLTNTYILTGILVTIALTIVPMALGLPIAVVLALARRSGNAFLAGIARFYVWIFRGTPLLVQLVIVFSALPFFGIKFNVWTSAVLALTLNEAAYLSEIVRSGFAGVPRGQSDAAMALGLNPRQTLRLVTWPQAMRLMLPPLGNSVNGLLKATSLTSVISMEELMRRTQVLMQVNFDVLELLAVAAIWYLALTTLWEFVQVRLEERFGRAELATSRSLDMR